MKFLLFLFKLIKSGLKRNRFLKYQIVLFSACLDLLLVSWDLLIVSFMTISPIIFYFYFKSTKLIYLYTNNIHNTFIFLRFCSCSLVSLSTKHLTQRRATAAKTHFSFSFIDELLFWKGARRKGKILQDVSGRVRATEFLYF